MTLYEQNINNLGKLITFGSLHLSLTLKLEKFEIQNLNIDFRKINSLSDLSFLIENEIFWERIELSSRNELLNTIFHMNRIKKRKNIVTYLLYDKLNFNSEQIKFQRLIDYILLSNGVVIYSFNIFRCKMNICFKIMYKNHTRKIMLFDDDNNEEENSSINYNNNVNEENKNFNLDEDEESKDNIGEINNIGLFKKFPENEINFGDFKYLYFHAKDYICGGEFQDMFKLKEIYNFLLKLKTNTKIKIIFNFAENLKYFRNYLIEFLKISDIHIFKKKAELIDILIKKNEIENKKISRKNDNIIKLYKIKKAQSLRKIKIRKNKIPQKNRISSDTSIFNLTKLPNYQMKSVFNSFYNTNIQKENNKNQNMKSILSPRALNLNLTNLTFDKQRLYTVDKSNIYNYIYELFYPNETQQILNKLNTSEKLGIYLEDFKKINIVEYKKSKLKPILFEYDLNIYPKINIHSLKQIENIKEILYTNYSLFSFIINGCILNIILDDIIKGRENYYLFYIYIRISVLKILSLMKQGLSIPTDKSFYLIQLKKNEMNKIISKEISKKKENGFNMNYFRLDLKEKLKKLRKINCSMTSMENKFYSTYMRNTKWSNNTTTNKRLINLKKGVNEKNGFWSVKNKNKKEKKIVYSFSRSMPRYACYLSKNQKINFLKKKLPSIKLQKKSKSIEEMHKDKINQPIKDEEEEIVQQMYDTSKYQELMFQRTQKDT